MYAVAVRVASGAAAAFLWAAPAMAAGEIEQIVPLSDAELSIRVGAAYLDMDVVNGFGVANDDTNVFFISQPDAPKMRGFGVQGGLDYMRPGGLDYMRPGGLYFSVDAFHVGDKSDAIFSSSEFLDTLPINGGTTPYQIGGFEDFNISSSTKYTRVAAAGGYDLGRFVLGAYASFSRLTFDSDVSNLSGGFVRLDEQVRAYSLGPMVAVRKEFPISTSLEGFIDGRAALLYSAGRLAAEQTASNLPGVLSVTDKSGDVAGMIDVRTGVNVLNLGGGKLSFFVGGSVRNDAYEINNPQSGPGLDADDPASYNPGPATIAQTLQLTGTAGLKFTSSF